ncbi:MAG: hypothetical protein IKK38_01425, partial [Spirochaetaceae bacterium]|nr:hypothetical protein [Spirochaetaceae bacterium]
FIRAEGLIPVSVGNIPLWGEIKGIKPECNSLAERTIPRTLCVGVRSLTFLKQLENIQAAFFICLFR